MRDVKKVLSIKSQQYFPKYSSCMVTHPENSTAVLPTILILSIYASSKSLFPIIFNSDFHLFFSNSTVSIFPSIYSKLSYYKGFQILQYVVTEPIPMPSPHKCLWLSQKSHTYLHFTHIYGIQAHKTLISVLYNKSPIAVAGLFTKEPQS